MALIKCAECGKEVSDKAPNCPNCGAPIAVQKFCKFCGEQIDRECIVCPKCGKQVEELNNLSDKNVIINNNVSASASSTVYVEHGRAKNKWISLLLCLFTVCGHKFYEGKVGMGIIYLFTAGLFGIGWFIDIIILLFKPNPYYV
jgi:RNA polymerase subunit RPABC4/transcription elongation factor Spt4